jgi:hypothetical protein
MLIEFKLCYLQYCGYSHRITKVDYNQIKAVFLFEGKVQVLSNCGHWTF